jgi:DUF1680 family protein
MFRFRFFIIVLFLCMLFSHAYALKPAELHPVRNKMNEDASVISTSSSPFAKLHGIPPRAVNLSDGFWKKRFTVNMERSIPTFFTLLNNVGARDKLLDRKNKARGNSDADLAKWVEAASFVLQSEDNKQLRNVLQTVVNDIIISGTNGGYLHSRYFEKMPVRLAQFRASGDLYCLGHLIQAGIAHYRATADKQVLDVLTPYIDNVIDLFGSGKQTCWSGHPEIEMALVELYRTTGKKEYLDFVRFLLDEVDFSEIEKEHEIDFEHYFTGMPFRSRKKLSGHAVCALYACCAAADYYLETGDQEIWQALMVLWDDLTKYKMYVTGGVGSRPWDEAIGNRFELPNEHGYAETCAAIGNVMWNWRLLHAGGEAIFTDIMELALYNGVLSGVSIGGDKYFYWNPLLSRFDFAEEQYVEGAKDLLALKKSRGTSLNIRQPYYRTPCCIPNIQRIIASLPGYMYSTSAKGLWIHLYHSGRLNWHLENGKELTIHQNTKYPWENTVEIIFENVPAEEFSLFFRVPGWTTSAGVSVNGRFFRSIHKSEHYHEIRRSWEKNDRIEIVFDMPARVVHAHPHLRENSGCVAIRRGPLIYCVESVDQQNVSVFDIVLPLNSSGISRDFEVMYDPNLLGGIVTITSDVLAYDPVSSDDGLYSFERFPRPLRPVKMIAIPYFAWANRGRSEMKVWIPWTVKQ